MRVAITGSSGLIGSALASELRKDGHTVVPVVRRTPRAGELGWDPKSGHVDDLRGIDAVVHLAGAGVGDRRWNTAYMREILESRTLGTRAIARAVVAGNVPVLVSGSAIGLYGITGDRTVDESAPQGEGFLANVVAQWEAAAQAAVDAGVRVTFARTGLVMSRTGGAMGRMLPLFRLGLGGRLGNGRQYWSSVSLHDEIRAIRFLLEHDVHGPFNITAPAPVTNAEFTRSLAKSLRRPAILPVPAIALRVAVGGFSSEILGSQRVVPKRLLEAGFAFDHPDVDAITSTLH